MADQASRGGQKKVDAPAGRDDEHRGTATQGAGHRSDADKQRDQRSNPDDAARQPTDQQR